MKFFAAAFAMLAIGVFLGLGLWLASHGHGPWVFIVAVVAFLGMFVRYGCRSH